MLKLLLVPVLIYLAIVAAVYFGQTSLIFPSRLVQGAGPLAPGTERLQLTGSDGNRLHGIHIPARSPGHGLLILGFPGNAWNAEHAAQTLSELYPRADIVAFHYRGYRPSSGSPSAAALLADAPLIHDFVAERFRPRRTVAVGFSIGTGVAAHLASLRALGGLILVTPFDSLAEVGHGHYPWLPVRLLLRHRMDPAEALSASPVPTALIVAERDTLIPPPRAQALAKRVRNLVFERTIANAGHNDIYQHPAFAPAMAQALEGVLGAASSR